MPRASKCALLFRHSDWNFLWIFYSYRPKKFDLPYIIWWRKNSNPQYVIFSNVLTFLLPYVEAFSSRLCSQAPQICVLPLLWQASFIAKKTKKVHFVYFIFTIYRGARIWFLEGTRDIFLPTMSRVVLRSTHRQLGAVCPAVKRQGHESGHSLPSTAKVKNSKAILYYKITALITPQLNF